MKDKHHTIELTAFQDWIAEAKLMYANSSRERKALFVRAYGGFEIQVNGILVWQGIQPFAAVDKYNSITEKFED